MMTVTYLLPVRVPHQNRSHGRHR